MATEREKRFLRRDKIRDEYFARNPPQRRKRIKLVVPPCTDIILHPIYATTATQPSMEVVLFEENQEEVSNFLQRAAFVIKKLRQKQNKLDFFGALKLFELEYLYVTKEEFVDVTNRLLTKFHPDLTKYGNMIVIDDESYPLVDIFQIIIQARHKIKSEKNWT